MKKLILLATCLFAVIFKGNAQVFWIENFESGSTSGLAVGSYTGPNGTWTNNVLSSEGSYYNEWYVSCAENGHTTGVCGTGCAATSATATRSTLHMGANASLGGDGGASYDAGGLCSVGICVTTDRRAESPTINCTGKSGIVISFYYIENGDTATDNATLWYYDGSAWSLLFDTYKTPTCSGGQGKWQHFSYSLPASANDNPNVKIGFRWVNNDDGSGTDPSFAVDSITLNGTSCATPIVGAISGASSVCAGGATTTFSDTTGGGAWGTLHPSVASISSSGIVSGISSGVDTITYSVTNSCGTTVVTRTITILSAPASGVITGATTVCEGATTAFSDTVSGGTWLSHTTAIATTSSSGMVGGASPGIDTITYTVSNSCGSSVANHIITVLTAPSAGTITGLSAVCVGYAIALTDTTTGGSWISGSPGIATIIGSSGTVRGVSAGTDTIKYVVSGTCGTSVATHVVIVTALPHAGTIAGATSVCAGGATISLTDTASGGTWISGTTSVATINSGSGRVTGVSVGSTMISYIVTNTCGSDTALYSITVRPLPLAGTISGYTSLCAGSTLTLIDTTSGGTWSSTSPGIATVNSSGVVTGVSGGRDTIKYSVSNSCGTASAIFVITVSTFPSAGTITGARGVCAGSATVLSESVSGGTWSSMYPLIATISSRGVVLGITNGIDTIVYTVSTSCGTNTISYSFSVDPYPYAGAVAGPSAICTGLTALFRDTMATGGVWSSTDTSVATITSSGSVTGLTVGVDTIKYTVANHCAASVAALVVTVELFSIPVAGSIAGPSSLCVGTTGTFIGTSSGGSWSSVHGALATINSGGIATGVTAGIDTIIYTVSNACGTADTFQPITINPLPYAGTIMGAGYVCRGSSTTLTDAAGGGSWSCGAGSSAYASVNSSGEVTGLSLGLATITYAVVNGCGADTTTQTVNVITIPSPGTISGRDSLCPNDTTTLTCTGTGGSWLSSNYATANVNSSGLVTGLATGVVVIKYAVYNSCGSDTAFFTMYPYHPCLEETENITERAPSLVVFPNPVVSGVFNINITSPENQEVMITITNTLGEKINQKLIKTNESNEVQLSRLPAGVYLLTTLINGQRLSERLVVQ